jgi:hypothetical protein
MRAILAYMEWLGTGIAKGEKAKGSGIVELAYLERAADPVHGAQVYTGKCASCHGEVETDAQLLCLGCSDSDAGAIYHEILFSRPPTRMCRYEFVASSMSDIWACGCPRCMQQTAQFFLARCLEEGLSSHSAPPSPSASDEEHLSFQVAMSLFE